MRKFIIVLPCLLLAHGIAAANEMSNHNDRQDAASRVLISAFESARTAEQPLLLSAPAATEWQYAAKKRRRAEAPPVRAEDKSGKSSKPNDRFYMTQNGKQMKADDFDAWMKKNGYRVATGAPAPSKKVADRNKEK